MNYWQELKGYFTPGGDPLWICPICGNGRHVYGVESWNEPYDKCPDCGTPLKYPFQGDDRDD